MLCIRQLGAAAAFGRMRSGKVLGLGSKKRIGGARAEPRDPPNPRQSQSIPRPTLETHKLVLAREILTANFPSAEIQTLANLDY